MRLSLHKSVPELHHARVHAALASKPQDRLQNSSGKLELLNSLQRRIPDYFSRCILLSAHGSYAYGIHPLEDLTHDLDLLGVSVPSKAHYLGWSRYVPETLDGFRWHHLPVELIDHEIKHFFLMLLKSSPNILPLLWTEEEHLLYVSPAGRTLIDSRDIFASKQIFETARGLARSCLHSDRQPNGSYHAVRTLRLASEFLLTGRFQVNRAGIDAQELREIKQGQKPQDEILALYGGALRDLEQAHRQSTLPEVPDADRAQNLLIDLIELQWRL